MNDLFHRRKIIILGLVLLAFVWKGRAQQQRLFTISKNTNHNVVCFDVQIDSNGCLNKEQPIICYWRLAGKDSVKPLNYLERKAYQYRLSNITGDTCRLVFSRLPQQDILLTNDSQGYRALVRVADTTIWLDEVHLVFRNRSLLQPVQRIDFYGKDSGARQKRDPGITAWINTGREASK